MEPGAENLSTSRVDVASTMQSSTASGAFLDYEQAAEATESEDVPVSETSADALAAAYGRVFQWETQLGREAPSSVLPRETSVLSRLSLDERVMTLLENVASTMHRVQVLEQEVLDHRQFILELHSTLLDVAAQVNRHDVSRRELSEAVMTLQQRLRSHASSARSGRSPRTPP